MKILLCHNFYQQYGGEDQIFFNEATLLEAHHHQVVRYTIHNDAITQMNPLRLAGATLWHKRTYREIRALLQQEKPQVVHFHNTFPLISPAAYYAAQAEGIPVIQNLQNYRLLCPNALFLRNGQVCEDCLGKLLAWPGIAHACYRHNRAATAVTAAMLTMHRLKGTWSKLVDVYTATTEFARQKFIQGGLPAERIVVKPNLVYPDTGLGRGQGQFALFVGRLAPEKGLDTLLTAWQKLAGKVALKIVGDGPLGPEVAEASQRLPGVEWLGQLSHDQVIDLMKEAQVLIFPSIWYEGLPMVIAEAFAVGLPVIASNLGAMASLIEPHRTGLHFPSGSAGGLVQQVEWVLDHPAELNQMRQEARREFEKNYTASRNYELLLGIYYLALERRDGLLIS